MKRVRVDRAAADLVESARPGDVIVMVRYENGDVDLEVHGARSAATLSEKAMSGMTGIFSTAILVKVAE